MNQGLSGGAKFGYAALGFFLALIGVLITWLINKDKEPQVKSGAIKFSLIGFGVSVVMWILLYAGLAMMGASLLAANGSF